MAVFLVFILVSADAGSAMATITGRSNARRDLIGASGKVCFQIAAQHSDAKCGEAQSGRGRTRRSEGKPRANRLYECGIRVFRDDLERRKSFVAGEPEHCDQTHRGDHEVLPGIQRPLPTPHNVETMREGQKVRNRPLVSVWPASAD